MNPRVGLTALTLTLAACPAPTAEGETDDADVTDTSAGAVPGCECIADDPPSEDWDTAPSWPTCGEKLCAEVETGESLEGNFVVINPDALDCALVALRERTPGWMTWSGTTDGGSFTDAAYIHVQPEGVAVRRDWGPQGLDWVVSDALSGELPSPEYFDECLALEDPVARFGCLRDTQLVETAVCNEGWLVE